MFNVYIHVNIQTYMSNVQYILLRNDAMTLLYWMQDVQHVDPEIPAVLQLLPMV